MSISDQIARLITPSVKLINHMTKTKLKTDNVVFSKAGYDKELGGMRHYLEVVINESVTLRVYFTTDWEAQSNMPIAEAYTANNPGTDIFYSHYAYMSAVDIKNQMKAVFTYIVESGGEIQFLGDHSAIAILDPASTITFLVDSTGNILGDHLGNLISLTQ